MCCADTHVAKMTDEDGLPIREIREDLDGTTIGPAPPPSITGTEYIVPSSKIDANEEYWSEAAQSRRARLRRTVFNEDTDSDLEQDIIPPKRLGLGSTSPSATPPKNTSTPTPSQNELPPTSPSPLLPSASSVPRTKSILKSAPRKKSVTFDDSVPLSPDSPGPTKGIKSDFPMPARGLSDNLNASDETMPRPVPTIIEPSPPVKSSSSRAFAAFKPGFLSSKPPSSVSTAGGAVKSDRSTTRSNDEPRQSLFAQRRTAELETLVPAETPAGTSSRVDASGSKLPRMSTVSQNSTMKTSVVEKPLPVASTSKNTVRDTHPVWPRGNTEAVAEEDEEKDEEDDDDDEYELDDALLAREVALDYHRRQRPIPYRHDENDDDEALYDRYLRDDDGDGDGNSTGNRNGNDGGVEGEDEELGGVMMAFPTVSNGKIVTPTPDELRKYVRVGRLENGNLVLAPGEQAWSDDEDASGARDTEATRRREEVKRQLLGQEPLPIPQVGPSGATATSNSGSSRRTRTAPHDDMGMPPSVKPVSEAVIERQPTAPPVQAAESTRKVSRFKAARGGG